MSDNHGHASAHKTTSNRGHGPADGTRSTPDAPCTETAQPAPGRMTRRGFFGLGGRTAAAVVIGNNTLAQAIKDHDARSFAQLHMPSARPRPRWQAHDSSDMPAPDHAVHLLNRAAYGPTPQDLADVRLMGAEAWIDRQLNYTSIDASAVEDPLAAGLPTLALNMNDLTQRKEHTYRNPDALNAAMFYRQTFSPRQLYEVMVDFGGDHFSIYQYNENAQGFKTIDDREVIRKHALGRFQDLLTASAYSPAMLHYLNNDENAKGHPNENYAREIMELHSLGVAVDGVPYSEDDVKELARCLTGWTWNNKFNDPVYGTFIFRPNLHDSGPKTVLGTYIPANGGEQDVLTVIDVLCHHPATARFLATKLVRRFVADHPQADVPELVTRVADVYMQTDGDIKAMVRTILTSDEFIGGFGSYGGRFARPMDLAVRMLRAVDVPQSELVPQLGDRSFPFHLWYYALVGYNGFMDQMGHVPFGWLTPDGYPDVKQAWSATAGMLARWNMALALANGNIVPHYKPHMHRPAGLKTADDVVDYWIDTLLHRRMLPEDRQLVVDFYGDGAPGESQYVIPREAQTVALILSSPYMQWR